MIEAESGYRERNLIFNPNTHSRNNDKNQAAQSPTHFIEARTTKNKFDGFNIKHYNSNKTRNSTNERSPNNTFSKFQLSNTNVKPANQTAKAGKNIFTLKKSNYDGFSTGIDNMKKRLTFNKYKSNQSGLRNQLEEELNSPHGTEEPFSTKRNKVSTRMGMTFKSRGNSHGHGLQLGNFISSTNNAELTKNTFKNSSLINNYGKTMNYDNSRIQGHLIESLTNVNEANKTKYYTPKTVQKTDEESTKSYTKIFNFPS